MPRIAPRRSAAATTSCRSSSRSTGFFAALPQLFEGTEAGHHRGEPAEPRTRHDPDGDLQQVRLDGGDHRQQVGNVGRLRHALRRHERRLQPDQGPLQDAGLRAGALAQRPRAAGRAGALGRGDPAEHHRQGAVGRACGPTRPTRIRCRPIRCSTTFSNAWSRTRWASRRSSRAAMTRDRAPHRAPALHRRIQAPAGGARREDHQEEFSGRDRALSDHQPVPGSGNSLSGGGRTRCAVRSKSTTSDRQKPRLSGRRSSWSERRISPDGGYLLINGDGLLYRAGGLMAASRLEKVDTGFAVSCNNDHGISPDGEDDRHARDKTEFGKSAIYLLPASRAARRGWSRTNLPSYWHGWSPDGRRARLLRYSRPGVFDIYTISVKGGEEKRLTHGRGSQ